MKNKKLSCETARKIPIEKALEFLGHFPTHNTEKEAWFLSPLRSETQASFKVSKKLNSWYDHGIGKGGNVIDLVCEHSGITVSEALEVLAKMKTVEIIVPEQRKHIQKTQRTIIKRIGMLKHPALLGYLKSRKIDIIPAKRYCREVHYTVGDSYYFAIGLKNDSGGWELRNKYFKSCSSPKDSTLICNRCKKLIVTEGMFDLLSITTLFPNLKRVADLLVLNSTSFAKKAPGLFGRYESIELYLDNDDAGRRTTEFLMENGTNVTDKSCTYSGFVDVNDCLMGGARI